MEGQAPMDHAEAVRTLAAERYLLDEMTAEEREAFEAHFFACAACAEAVETGAILAEAAGDDRTWARGRVAPFPSSAAPAVPPPGRRMAATWIPLAAAAVLALVVGYQSLVTIPDLQSTVDTPRALVPVPLAPTSRGDGATVAQPAEDGLLALALDINADRPTGDLVYDLRTLDGTVVSTGQAAAPPEGTPLLLLLPGTSLSSGQYALVVRDSASPAREVGTYRFTVR